MSQPTPDRPPAAPARASYPATAAHQAAGASPIIPTMLLVAGAYLAWFGVHYWRTDVKWPTDPIKAVLTGQPIPVATKSDPTTYLGKLIPSTAGGTTAPTFALTGTNAFIATDAVKYVGAGYQFGGNASRVGDWDCSSFVSYVLGHDLGITLPGGGRWGDPGYPPHAHGPTAAHYKLFGGSINRSDVAAGDIVAWNTHVGIAVSNSQIVAARTPSAGTGLSGIESVTAELGETPAFRRVVTPNTTGGPAAHKPLAP